MDCTKIKEGDQIKLRSEPDTWWTVEKSVEMTKEIRSGKLCCRMFYFVEPHAPATEPNVVGHRNASLDS